MAWYDEIVGTTKENVQGLVDALRNPVDTTKQFLKGGEKNRKIASALLQGNTAPLKQAFANMTPQDMENAMMNVGMTYAPMGIVSKATAKNINMPLNLPNTPEFNLAVQGTKNAKITPEGLEMSLQRFQKPEQELSEAGRSGVFYLPEGSAQAKYYKGKGSVGGAYGGNQAIQGETLYKNPLFVKGATGGKAPEEAYKQLAGKDKFNEMQSDLMKVIQAHPRIAGEEAYMFLEKHAPEIADNAWNIIENSKQGNQLRYALQEAVFANEARNAGYDSILGHSKGKSGPYLSEVFDLRESHYPSPSGEFYMHPMFENLIKK